MRTGDEKTRRLLRLNSLATGSMSLLASVLFLTKSFPYHKSLAVLSFWASLFYFTYFIFFERICRWSYRGAGITLSQIGVLVITAAIYYSGGVVSPFTFLYFAILVAESIYGLNNPITMPVSVAGYLFVVSGLYFGFLPNPVPWSMEAYDKPLFVSIVALLVVGYLALAKGLTERIVLNLRAQIDEEASEKEALVRKFSELNSTTQLGVLAHRIAHDLRGPIASISGYLEMEMAAERSPEKLKELNSVSETVTNMVETLHGITRFGKPGGPSAEKIVLADFMRDIVAIASFSPRSKGVSFQLDEPGERGLAVIGSRADLQQAFFNIVKNAVEAVSDNHDGKHVRISIKREGQDALVSISDDGPGIPAGTLESIFRRSVTTKKDGTGVGLLITRDLLVRNRGEIKLRNRDDGGVTAEAALPLA
jgi:signal transduction histidine kinase